MTEFAPGQELPRTPELDVSKMSEQEVELALEGIARVTEIAHETDSAEVTLPFGTQMMEVRDDFEKLELASGGPTWTGSKGRQSPDDGDTGPGTEN